VKHNLYHFFPDTVYNVFRNTELRKTRCWGYHAVKEFDAKLSRLETIPDRHKETDNKYHAYA